MTKGQQLIEAEPEQFTSITLETKCPAILNFFDRSFL